MSWSVVWFGLGISSGVILTWFIPDSRYIWFFGLVTALTGFVLQCRRNLKEADA